MASETYIICKEINDDVPDDIDFEILGGRYYFTFDSDLLEMKYFLSVCKVSADINDVYLSCCKPLIELVDRLQIKNYLIQYEHDFAGAPDDNGFTIPILNGIILNKLIVDKENEGFAPLKRAFKAVGLDYP